MEVNGRHSYFSATLEASRQIHTGGQPDFDGWHPEVRQGVDAELPNSIGHSPERFAIAGVLISRFADFALVGEQDEVRFRDRVKPSPTPYKLPRYYDGERADWVSMELMNILAQDVYAHFNDAGKEFLSQADAQTLQLAERHKYLFDLAIEDYQDEKQKERVRSQGNFYDALTLTDTVRSSILTNLIWNNLHEGAFLDAETIRDLAIQNLDFAARIATKNAAHAELITTQTNIDELEVNLTDPTDPNFGKLFYESEKIRKPTERLAGPTLRCPATYTYDEELEPALQRMGIAMVNEAYDRGILNWRNYNPKNISKMHAKVIENIKGDS